MIFFKAYCHFDKITDITPEILKKINVDTLFLDIDNTLKINGAQTASDEVMDWIEQMKKNKTKMVLCSNNFKKTVQPFADITGITALHMCLKPSPFGFMRALRATGSKRKNVLVCGDQLFTDILGARLSFLKSAMIEPIYTDNERKTVRLRRFLLQRARKKNLQRKNPF